MKHVPAIALALTIIGGINWLLVGAFDFNLVTTLFGLDANGMPSGLSRAVYIVVGIAALYCITLFKLVCNCPMTRDTDTSTTTTTYTTPTV